MGSSELSDALNPLFSHSSHKSSYPQHLSHHSTPQLQLQPHALVEHSPQLHVAVTEFQQQSPAVRSRPSSTGLSAVQELLRIVQATKEAQEAECQRRLAWEREHELKHSEREAALEKQVQELREELNTLRQSITTSGGNAQVSTSTMSSSPSIQLSTPVSPVMQHASTSQHTFIQGSSFPIQSNPSFPSETQPPSMEHYHQSPPISERPVNMPTSAVPIYESHDPTPASRSEASRSPPPVKPKKRRKVESSSSSEFSGGSDSDTLGSPQPRVSRRRNHHDKRCLTHAIRLHTIRLMGLEHDKMLPDSHPEGTPLDSSQPVRFVWDKTSKQSVHNARMKTRILDDLKENRRRLYKHVPEREFNKKTLDAAFDQCFTTLRQKFKGQRDKAIAEHDRSRDKNKIIKARRLQRKKAKLDSRVSARLRLTAYEHSTFDGAFELECMSSEESDADPDAPQSRYLITHGCRWRSKRLVKFYEKLDEDDREVGATKPKRGLGKLDRVTGDLKPGFQLPPKGVASWMVSRRWILQEQTKHPDFNEALQKLIRDPQELDWVHLQSLGEESEDEQRAQHQHPPMMNMMPNHHMPPQQYEGSSLQYALT
ncbi:hypothetical protein WG66_012263 [Moniliophthora roreri]|uniref:Uncharacterized protein n=1 Tax=Moniliophthora roreri TaxID=221103 RepID=A0A0W0EZC2_MONRR|nr:hypothetical protein WG66_012263 [Moniliophthora roreri]